MPQPKLPTQNVKSEDIEEEDDCLPWENPQVPLDPALQRCLKKIAAGDKFPAKTLLDEVPVFEGLKSKAEDNNHGQDSRSPQDKMLKAWQQRMLNMARVVACLYPAMKDFGEDYDVATQQLFFYILETESQVLKERKRRSVPGAAIEVSNALFTQDDLKRNNQVYQVNQAGLSRVGRVRTPLMLYFRNPAGNKSFKFRGLYSKGRGKPQNSSYGFGHSWRSTWKSPQGGFGRGFGRGKPSSKWTARCLSYGSTGGFSQGYGSRSLHGASREWLCTTSPTSVSFGQDIHQGEHVGGHSPSFETRSKSVLVANTCPPRQWYPSFCKECKRITLYQTPYP